MNKFSVHQSNWVASIILFLSFFSGWSGAIFLEKNLDHYWVIRLWLIWCFIPLILIAYKQSPNRLKSTLNSFNKERIIGKSKVLTFQIIGIIIFSSLVSYIPGGESHSIFAMDMFFMLPIIVIFIPIYVYFTDRRLINPYDEYIQIADIINKKIPLNKTLIKKFLLKTLVKCVFVPFMYSGFLGNLEILLNTSFTLSIPSLSITLFNIGINLDMLVGTFGYLISSSLINNQIRDTDSNFLGWLFALLCYPPLVSLRTKLSSQTDNLIWSDIIPQDTILYWIMFLIINLLWIIYWLATFEFGMGFSNLSYRKLVNTGVYRYTKHPAYLAKNLYWWLYTLPFCGVALFSANWWENMFTLTLTSLIYYGRACSEERHLMKFPEYQAYAEYISQYGIFRKISLPWIK